jgi:integrase
MQQIMKNSSGLECADPQLDRKIEVIAEGVGSFVVKKLRNLSKENIATITNFILAINTESNPSDRYRQQLLLQLCELSKFVNEKEFGQITREDLIQYMDKFRKPESVDPLHKWIGTYNLFLTLLVKFFRWLYYPDLEPKDRPRPEVIQNIPQLKRKEKSIYKPSDLWTPEDDSLFLKYCGSKRMACYHTIIRDTGCRPHEILKLKLKDIVFKSEGDRQYAEVVVNGKTGTRPLPLIDSLPYLKAYLLNEHPLQGNPNAALIAGNGKSLGRPIKVVWIEGIYSHYKKNVS